MRIILTVAFITLAGAALAEPPATKAETGKPDGLTVVRKGEATGSLEDMALIYFREVAHFDNEAGKWPVKDMLRDNDGFTEAEVEEVLAVARSLNTPQAQAAFSERSRETQRLTCEELRIAATTEESVAVLSGKVAREAAEKRMEGVQLLAQLKPSTRAKLYKILVEYRKGMTRGSRDWSKANAQQIEKYKAKYCSN